MRPIDGVVLPSKKRVVDASVVAQSGLARHVRTLGASIPQLVTLSQSQLDELTQRCVNLHEMHAYVDAAPGAAGDSVEAIRLPPQLRRLELHVGVKFVLQPSLLQLIHLQEARLAAVSALPALESLILPDHRSSVSLALLRSVQATLRDIELQHHSSDDLSSREVESIVRELRALPNLQRVVANFTRKEHLCSLLGADSTDPPLAWQDIGLVHMPLSADLADLLAQRVPSLTRLSVWATTTMGSMKG